MLAGMPLSLGLDARAAFVDPVRGLGRVTRQLVEALIDRDDLKLTVFVPARSHVPERWYRPDVHLVHLQRPRRGAFLWDGPAWRWCLQHHPVDVLHIPAWGIPPGVPVPVVSTLHDITPLLHPGTIRSRRVRHRACRQLETQLRATLVHAVSEHTAQDGVRGLGIPPDRLRVVGHGIDPEVFTTGAPAQPAHFLFVGGADPHKGLGLLLDAWALPRAADLPALQIVGPAAVDPGVERRAAALPPGRVRLQPPVDDLELARLYRTAVALLLPSRAEGFGLPVLEAMACGCPVVACAAGALPEVGGDAAVYLPTDADPLAWLEVAARVAEDPEHRAALAHRGLARAAGRTWTATAAALVGVYREALTARA